MERRWRIFEYRAAFSNCDPDKIGLTDAFCRYRMRRRDAAMTAAGRAALDGAKKTHRVPLTGI
jgi:hypothetical protein